MKQSFYHSFAARREESEMEFEIGVLGAGAFGTALATAFARSGRPVRMWARNSAIVDEINRSHTNLKYSASRKLPDSLSASDRLDEVFERSNLLIYACPSSSIRHFLGEFSKHLTKQSSAPKLFVSTAKGFEVENLKLHHEIAEELLGKAFVRDSYFCLSGPSFAAEILDDKPTCLAISGQDWRRVLEVQKTLSAHHLRLYANTDLVGSQLGGAMKNVIAIGAGVSDGLKLGHNTQAALINLGLGEIARLGRVLGAKTETFLGLSGMGDLVLTCTSALSRNRSFGALLGSGLSIEEAKTKTGSTIEGIGTADAVMRFSEKLGVRTPICREVYQILHSKKPVREAFDDLLSLPPGGEWL
jgi:glycerol-3-phosphate dehydrogenase (NAD(P)+)